VVRLFVFVVFESTLCVYCNSAAIEAAEHSEACARVDGVCMCVVV